MSRDWTIRVQPAEREPFVFRASFLSPGSPDEDVLEMRYLYGDGDLAVFLEDLGAGSSEIWTLLESLRRAETAEILIDVTEEAMEVLSNRRAEH